MDPEVGSQPDTNDDADFDAGFTNAPTETPAVEPVVEPEEVKQPEPEYVQLTKAELESLRASAALIDEIKATQAKSFGTAFGKIGGIERTLQELQKPIDISQESIDAIKDDIPELGEALQKIRDIRVMSAGVDPDKVGEIVESKVQQRLQEQHQRTELRLLGLQHPDWRQIDADPEFAQWVGTQPADFIAALAKANESFDSEVVGDAMSKFKASRKPKATAEHKPKQMSRIQAAVTPRGSGGQTLVSTEDDEFDAGFSGR